MKKIGSVDTCRKGISRTL